MWNLYPLRKEQEVTRSIVGIVKTSFEAKFEKRLFWRSDIWDWKDEYKEAWGGREVGGRKEHSKHRHFKQRQTARSGIICKKLAKLYEAMELTSTSLYKELEGYKEQKSLVETWPCLMTDMKGSMWTCLYAR